MKTALMAMAVLSAGTVWAGTYGGGSGTEMDPFQIRTAAQMNAIGTNPGDWASHFKLMADIDMSGYSGTQYQIIGNSDVHFTGSFDGSRRVIRNLTYTTTSAVDNVGLFGYAHAATIRNLGVENAVISSGGDNIGGLMGRNSRGKIDSCYVTGLISGANDVGGLIGASVGFGEGDDGYYSEIGNSYSHCNIQGPANSSGLGGLVGYNFVSNITNCYSEGNVTGGSGSSYLGGLVGYNNGERESVLGGGFYGSYYYYSYIIGCYSTVGVKGSAYTGGVVGSNGTYGEVSFCFWDINTSGMTAGVGNAEPDPDSVTGATTAQLKTMSIFLGKGWDFIGETANGTDDHWRMLPGFYPLLAWQVLAPEIAIEHPAGANLTDNSGHIAFGTVAVRKAVTKTFTIRNTGSATLSKLAVTINGRHARDFIVSKPRKASLPPGGSTTFKVTFKPRAAGARKAAIHIRSNDADENPFDIKLQGKQHPTHTGRQTLHPSQRATKLTLHPAR